MACSLPECEGTTCSRPVFAILLVDTGRPSSRSLIRLRRKIVGSSGHWRGGIVGLFPFGNHIGKLCSGCNLCNLCNLCRFLHPRRPFPSPSLRSFTIESPFPPCLRLDRCPLQSRVEGQSTEVLVRSQPIAHDAMPLIFAEACPGRTVKDTERAGSCHPHPPD